MFTIKEETFEGPLDLLLSLIEKEQLDITQISLANITGEYLVKIGELDGDSNEIADFLVIAAKLLYIKSRNLIPTLATEEEEAEIEDLETKLREYQQYKLAAKHLENVLADESRSYSRRGKNEVAITFTPPTNLDNKGLFALFQEILGKAEAGTPKEAVIEDRPKVTLKQRRDHILKHIRKGGKVSFRATLADATTKADIIVTFLAILEMVKQKEVRVEQDNNFSDFMIIGVK
jgi:segregation and condensation protein A